MRDPLFEFFGMVAIFGVAALLFLVIEHVLGAPDVIPALIQLSPWLGANARTLSWVAIAVVALTAVALPAALMFKRNKDGGSRLGDLGFMAWLALLVPSLGFLLFVGWYGAQHLVGEVL